MSIARLKTIGELTLASAFMVLSLVGHIALSAVSEPFGAREGQSTLFQPQVSQSQVVEPAARLSL